MIDRLKRSIPAGLRSGAFLGAALAAHAALCTAAAAPPPSGEAAARGLAIMTEAQRRDQGWADATANITMVLRTRRGRESVRRLRIRTIELQSDGDKTLIIFDTPRDIKGTTLLTFSHKVANDDQWLYLPALKRVKRIASANRSGPFVGSEFAYEDMSSPEIEKYTYKYLRDDKLDGLEVFVVERYPVDRNSGYTRQVVWLDKAEYQVRKVAFHDRRDSLLKTLVLSDYRKYLGKYWRPDRSFMSNHQTGKNTLLTYTNYKFKTGLRSRDFNRNKLKNVR